MSNFEVFFISYEEPNAESNLVYVQELAPEVKRVQGVKGISNAYAEVAKQATADYVYIVEADNFIKEGFTFKEYNDELIHVWPAINRSTQSLTFNGGVKLFPLKALQETTFNKIDVLILDHPIIFEEEVASYHAWDTDEFHTVSHALKQILRLRMMREAGEPGIEEEWNHWHDKQRHSVARSELIMRVVEYADELSLEDLAEDFFDNHDIIKSIYETKFKLGDTDLGKRSYIYG
jgi:hypothetical protein